MKLGNLISNDQPVTSSIIPGSVVGPGLRALFINQLALCLKVPSVLLADDVKMLFNLQLMDNTETQAEIDVFCEWCDKKEVQINTDKSRPDNNNTFHPCDNTPIPTATSFKDLGVVTLAD